MQSVKKHMGNYLLCVIILLRIPGIETDCQDIVAAKNIFIHSETNHYYYDFGLNMDYVQAKVYCESYEDTHLVFLETVSESNWFLDKINEINLEGEEIVIGAEMDHESGKLYWVHGNQIISEVSGDVMNLFSSYNPSKTQQDRVFYRNGVLKQANENNNEDFICECEDDSLGQTTKNTTTALEQTTKDTTADLKQTTTKDSTAALEHTTTKDTTAALEHTTTKDTTAALEHTTTKGISTAPELITTRTALEPSPECSEGTSGQKRDAWFGRYQLVWTCVRGAETWIKINSYSVIHCARKCQASQECFAFMHNVSVKECMLLRSGTGVYSSCSTPNNCYILV